MTENSEIHMIQQLELRILEILKQSRPEVDFESSDDLVMDGFVDSFEIVMLTTEFEKVFGVNIPGEDIVPEVFASISTMAALVKKLQIKA